MNSTLSNLNFPTACGKALRDRGSATYIEACKPHTNILPWDIVCTSGGNLPCQYVIHAFCCDWNTEDKDKSEKVSLQFLIICLDSMHWDKDSSAKQYKMGIGLRFEQYGYWNGRICALGKWDLVKIFAGKIWKRTPLSSTLCITHIT